MKVLDRADTPLERPEDKRLVEPPDPRVCPVCGGWGYPRVDYIPEKQEGRWVMRVKAKACVICQGSGFQPLAVHGQDLHKGRVYHNQRLERMCLWLGSELERKAGKGN